MKKTINEIKQRFADQGCELLDDVYVNAHVKMRYKCICGNESWINLNNFSNGKRCGCGKRNGCNRLTSEEIKTEVESIGYQFISEELVNNKHVIKCLCKCGSIRSCELRTLRGSENCSKCRNQDLKLKFEDVKQFFVDHGCELLEDNYVNARTKMKYRCACGNNSQIVFDSFRRGNRCKNCGVKKSAEKQTLNHDEVAAYFKEQGCALLDQYQKAQIPLRYICVCGKEAMTSWSNFKNGRRCSCRKTIKKRNINKQNVKKHFFNQDMQDEISTCFTEQGCVLLDQYKKADVPLRFICNCGNEGAIKWSSFEKGIRCRKCSVAKRSGSNHYEWRVDREAKNNEYIFRQRCYKLLKMTLNVTGCYKNKRTAEMLGYDSKQLQEHITNHSNFEKVKTGKWHIDHIFPITAFLNMELKMLLLLIHLIIFNRCIIKKTS